MFANNILFSIHLLLCPQTGRQSVSESKTGDNSLKQFILVRDLILWPLQPTRQDKTRWAISYFRHVLRIICNNIRQQQTHTHTRRLEYEFNFISWLDDLFLGRLLLPFWVVNSIHSIVTSLFTEWVGGEECYHPTLEMKRRRSRRKDETNKWLMCEKSGWMGSRSSRRRAWECVRIRELFKPHIR